MPDLYTFQQDDNFSVAVALGLFSGIDRVASAGFSGTLAATTETDISGLGVTTIPLPSNAGQTIQIWSTNVADNQEIQVSGLGPNGAFMDPQTGVLNGTTPVDLGLPMSRINEAINISNTGVLGTINIGVSPATIFCNILSDNQLSKQALYSVPEGYTLITPSIVSSFRKSVGVDTGVLISAKTKNFTQSFFYRTVGFELVRGGNSSAQFGDEFPAGLIGPFDVKISANSDSAGSEVLARLNGLLVRRA